METTLPNNSMQRTALRAAADAERWGDPTANVVAHVALRCSAPSGSSGSAAPNTGYHRRRPATRETRSKCAAGLATQPRRIASVNPSLHDLDEAAALALSERIAVVQGDIVTLCVDVIVNAANSALSGGGGVDGAIHRAAGPALLAECRAHGRCPIGSAVLTAAYNLDARYVVHAVGPAWDGGDHGERNLLESCYRETLRLAASVGATSIAFPAIGCGAYKFPLAEAARIAVRGVASFLRHANDHLSVTFVCFDRRTKDAWEAQLRALLAPSPHHKPV
jgi:O-acetyl-ADP-ribose deacetylase (regulator of RNase III)